MNIEQPYLGSGIDAELELGLLSVINRQTLHKQGSESGSSTTSEGVEDEEALESSAVIGESADTVQYGVDDFLKVN